LISKVFADVPATAFYVVKTAELKELVAKSGELEELDILTLEDMSVAKGYFEGDCSFYLKTKDYQYRFKARSTEDNLIFSFRMFSQETKKNIFSSNGEAKVTGELSVKENWQEEEYVVLFCQKNLAR